MVEGGRGSVDAPTHGEEDSSEPVNAEDEHSEQFACSLVLGALPHVVELIDRLHHEVDDSTLGLLFESGPTHDVNQS